MNLQIEKIIIFISFLVMACNNMKDQSLSEEFLAADQRINDQINNLAYTISQQGGYIDSNFFLYDRYHKLDYLNEELKKCMFITSQAVKLSSDNYTIKIDSVFKGAMMMAGYNDFLKNKCVIKFNNTVQDIPLDKNYNDYSFKLKPYKLGENKFNGYLVQGRDTYAFGAMFTAIK